MMAPTLAEACTVVGAAVKLALMPPTRVVRLTEALVRPVASMTPAFALAVTLPARPVSRTAPAPAVTRTVTDRGTVSVYATPQTSSAGQSYVTVSVLPLTVRVVVGGVLA